MIIDGPNTIDLAIGTDKRIIEASDAQLIIPPMLFPVTLNARPHSPAPTVTTTLFQGSAFSRTTEVVNPPSSAALTQNVMNLDKGLWELELSLTSKFDFDAAFGSLTGNAIRMTYQGVNFHMLYRYATTGTFVDYNRFRLLLQSAAQLFIQVAATGVAQNAAGIPIINAIKIL